jgi:hypothetical protein
MKMSGETWEGFGRDLTGCRPNFWGPFAADPPLATSIQILPGDVYFNTTTRQMRMVDATRRAWVTVGPPRIYDDFTDAALNTHKWTAGVAGGGTVAMLVAGASYVNGAVRLNDSGAGGDNHAEISAGTNLSLQRGSLTLITFRIQLSSIAAGLGARVRAILFNAGAFNAVGNWAGFEFAAAVNANWRIRSSVGGAAVVDADSGVAAVAGAITELTIVIYANIAYLYINGVQVGTISAANLTAAQLEPDVYIDDGAVVGGAVSCDVDLIAAYQ